MLTPRSYSERVRYMTTVVYCVGQATARDAFFVSGYHCNEHDFFFCEGRQCNNLDYYALSYYYFQVQSAMVVFSRSSRERSEVAWKMPQDLEGS